MDSKEWFKEAKFGMMVHFGLYSLLGGEWKGKQMKTFASGKEEDIIGEWAQAYFRIPNAEYHELAKAFNPIYFNADEWVKLACDAGMKYIVITSKHHEGFALFKSEVNKFNVVDATPFKRDIVGELAEACYKRGVKLGLYYSQALDWEQQSGGGYDTESYKYKNYGLMPWVNDWDYTDNYNKNYSQCFEDKIKPQVKEILTKYGDLCLIWFDTPKTISPKQSKELYDMVKLYQPNCLINSRIGNGLGDYRSGEDNGTSEDNKEGLVYEVPATLNKTWGYKSYDQDWKDAKKVIEIKNKLNEKGINYLLNVGPDHLGRFPARAVEILREVGKSQK